MRKIGDWVWYYDEYKNKYISQIIGFESDGRLRLAVYPENVGQIRIMFSNYEEVHFPTLKEMLGEPTEEGESEMTNTRAYTDGYNFAMSLGQVFEINIKNGNAVFELAERFAKLSDYSALQDGMQFVKGFVVAFQESQSKQIESVSDK